MHRKQRTNCLVLAGILVFAAGGSFPKDAKFARSGEAHPAYVFVDGSAFGHGSRNISVAPGKHTIGVYNHGFKPEVRDVSLTKEEH